MKKRLKEIFKKNAEFEKEAPYNFCDRWCERCTHEKQVRCSLYKDEMELKITCIAHGRDEDDPEITKAIMEEQYQGLDDALGKCMDKFDIDLDDPDIDEDDLREDNIVDFENLPLDIQEHIQFVENNALNKTAQNYSVKVHDFLKEAFYENKKIAPELKYDFETISWYHTLLPAKLHRALCGFHRPVSEEDISLYDAVAQFQICKKAITQSIKALRKISKRNFFYKQKTQGIIALLHNIHSRIEKLEDSIT